MSTSGTTTWSLKRDSIINAALRKLAVLPSGGSASTTQITDATEAMNTMLKGFMVDGMPLWAIKEYTFNTVAGTNAYNIGNGQTLATPMPMKVIQGYRIESPGASNIPLNVYNHYDFNLLPVNASSGEPVNMFYQPFSTFGTIKLWPTPSDATTTITIIYQRPFEDMVASTDDVDFPPYWTEAIVFGLAWRLSYEYGIPIMDRQEIQKIAEYFHGVALSFGEEEGSLFVSPDETYRR